MGRDNHVGYSDASRQACFHQAFKQKL